MSNYSESYYEEHEPNTSWYKALRLIPDGSKVLDIGCSSGNFGTELISQKKCTVDGIELDSGDVAKAKKHLRRVYQLNVETDDLGVVQDKYDIIYFGDVIEHLFHPIEALQRVKKLLTPSGKIVFSIPNMGHILIRLMLLRGDFSYTETGILDKTHVHFFNLKEVERVFEEAGFVVSKLDYTEKDFPDGFITDWCKEVGIEVTDRYLQITNGVEAAAFQFVGVASQAPAKKHKLDKVGPPDYFSSYHNSVVDPLKKQVKDLQKQNDYLSKKLEIYTTVQKNPLKFAYRKVKRTITNR